MPEMADCKRDEKYRESVIHLIPDTGFKHGEHICRKAAAQRMGAKSTRRNAEKVNRRADKQKGPVHCK